ncbi:ISL3 family transposase [Niabella terrae]
MNLTQLIFNSADRLEVISIDRHYDSIAIRVKSKASQCLCPKCGKASRKIRSYYCRKLADLPAFGGSCRILLRARKFKCCNKNCEARIFTERFKAEIQPYQRRTSRLTVLLQNLALQMGGRPAERLCSLMSIAASDTTLLRLIYKTPLPAPPRTKAIGVDDWAYTKRRLYGSILVDLTTNKPIGLLPDRETATLRNWLKTQPHIRIVSRDRYSKFQKGISEGAPRAIQVTDRWHLLQNLHFSIRKILDREHMVLGKVRQDWATMEQKKNIVPKTPTIGVLQRNFQQVKEMLSQGVPVREISRRLKMCRVTIRKYRQYDQLPLKSYSSSFNQMRPYIEQRLIEQPNITVRVLHKELQSKGYSGCYSVLAENIVKMGLRKKSVKKDTSHNLPKMDIFWRPSKTSILFFKKRERLQPIESDLLKSLCERSSQIQKSYRLVMEFLQIMLDEKMAIN